MKHLIILIFLLSITTIFPESMSNKSFIEDKELNSTIVLLNYIAKSDLDTFKTELSLNYKISKYEIGKLLENNRIEPSDIYIAVEISKHTPQSFNQILTKYKFGQNWSELFRELGIFSDSKEYQTIKKNLKKYLRDKSNTFSSNENSPIKSTIQSKDNWK